MEEMTATLVRIIGTSGGVWYEGLVGQEFWVKQMYPIDNVVQYQWKAIDSPTEWFRDCDLSIIRESVVVLAPEGIIEVNTYKPKVDTIFMEDIAKVKAKMVQMAAQCRAKAATYDDCAARLEYIIKTERGKH